MTFLFQAYIKKNQTYEQEQVSILECAQKLGVGVFTSVPLMQGRLLDWVKNSQAFSNFTPSVGALQFVRSTPGVLAPLIEAMKIPPFSENEFHNTVKKLVS